MKFSASFSRSVGMALALAILGAMLARGQAVIIKPYKRSDASSNVTLAPEVEAKLKELLDKTKVKKDETWDAQMKKEIDDVATVTGLSDAGKQSLAVAAKQAVAASMQNWAPDLPDVVRRQLARLPKESAVAMIVQAQDQLGEVLDWSDANSHSTVPDQQDIWSKALHQTLSPTQFDAWSQSQSKHKDEIEKQIADVLKSGADRTHDQQTKAMMNECKGIENALKLPPDRAAQLESFAKAAVSQTVEKGRAQEEKALLAMGEEQRRQMLTSNFYMEPGPDDVPMQMPAWKDGLAHLLSADEQAKLLALKDDRKTRREHVMSLVMVMLLDDKIALTAAQREKLEPITERLVKNIPQLYPQGNPGEYYSVNLDVFYTATTNTTDEELKPILDTVQLKRWHDLATTETPQDVMQRRVARPAAPNADEPEDVDKAISNFFYEKTESQRKEMLETNALKAEDAARVAGLSAESAERLEAAAAGTTEQSLMTWKWFTEQQIRSQLQGLTPQNVNQRLDGLQDFFFQRRFFGMNNRQDLWDQTVQSELTAPQLDAWKKETDAREDYRGKAIAAVVLSEFDRQVHLTDDQWDKLGPLVSGVLSDYSQGITQVFSNMNGTPWYLGGNYNLIPLLGLEDQQLQAVLTKDQMDLWTGSQEFANASSLWQVVKQMHAQQQRVQKIRRTARAVIQD
jgi:hypothetical protein